jgi:hypothetical protein
MRLRAPSERLKLLEPRIVEKLLELVEARGSSWTKRSVRRMYDVYECMRNKWIVRGRRELGDSEDIYVVEYDEESGSFRCTCHQPYKPYASTRRRACSHVGACLFYHLFF